MNSPIAQAVLPQKEEMVRRCVAYAQSYVDRLKAELEAADMDANKVAPYPTSSHGGYKMAVEKYKFVRRIFTIPYVPCRRPHDPEIVSGANVDQVRKYLKEEQASAALAYDAYVSKLETKVGECLSASVEGYVWNGSVLTVTKFIRARNVEITERWSTKQILNVSCLGKLFNQWPTRLMK